MAFHERQKGIVLGASPLSRDGSLFFSACGEGKMFFKKAAASRGEVPSPDSAEEEGKNADFRKLNNPKLSILKKILYFHNFHLK